MKKTKGFNFNRYALIFFIVLIIIAMFTFVDYIVHSLKAEYSVPSYYFRNKIIFGTLIGYVTLLFTQKYNTIKRSLIMSIIVSVLLQIRYFLEGYSKTFVFEFLFIHFVILLPASWIMLKLFERKLESN